MDCYRVSYYIEFKTGRIKTEAEVRAADASRAREIVQARHCEKVHIDRVERVYDR